MKGKCHIRDSNLFLNPKNCIKLILSKSYDVDALGELERFDAGGRPSEQL
jgi:hypothetical protein